jgi:hypothetical protein
VWHAGQADRGRLPTPLVTLSGSPAHRCLSLDPPQKPCVKKFRGKVDVLTTTNSPFHFLRSIERDKNVMQPDDEHTVETCLRGENQATQVLP